MPTKKAVAKKSDSRIAYFDYLRVAAIVAVVFLHVAANKWYSTDVNGFAWQTFNIYDSIARWGVSIFVMISGALFLSKETPTKILYKKHILRLLIAFLVWSIIYALINGKSFDIPGLVSVIKGHYHMWFIPMIIGLYMCVPLLKPIVKKTETTKYFLFLSLIFAFIIPEATRLISVFGDSTINKIAGAASSWISDMHLDMILGYTSIFVLGYYLHEKQLEKKHRLWIYVGGVIGAIATIMLSVAASLKAQKAVGFYGNFTLNVLLEAIAVFTWFKYRDFKNNKVISGLSKLSFGVYLVHPLVLQKLSQWTGLTTRSFNAVLSVPTIVGIVLLVSFSISAILKCIPIVKKYIV
ncbi:acyltransferase family protein [Candidatus Saccharibacteria bacterium]|nr:acyltransferase family protein [Candidatus Saccharibacteria bacterium]